MLRQGARTWTQILANSGTATRKPGDFQPSSVNSRYFGGLRYNVICCLPRAPPPALASDLNTLSTEHKLPPLEYSATLSAAAQAHARDMALCL